MALQSDHEFAPTQIARAVFPTAFRGYDQDAVRRYLSRLAAALEHQQEYAGLGQLEARTPAHERVEELEEELESLRDEIKDLELELVQRSVDGDRSPEDGEAVDGGPGTGAFDEHRVIELLGQETARVLESARSAAADILKRAETQAASLKSQARSELSEAKRRAESLVAEKQAETEELVARLASEAEATADRITGEAEEHRAAVLEESSKILTEAEATARAEQAGAEERARQIVADAETLRQQVISELVAERRQAQGEMDRMIAARDRLAMSLAVARSELDEVADALVDASAFTSFAGTPDADRAPVIEGEDAAEVDGLISSLEAGSSPAPAGEAASHDDAGPLEAVAPLGEGADDEPPGEPADAGDEPTSPEGADAAEDRRAASGRSKDASSFDDGAEAFESLRVDTELAGSASERPGDPAAEDDDVTVIDVDEVPEIDLDDVPGHADDVNRPPADGSQLSLVEGFTTIEVNDIEPAGALGAQGAGVGVETEPERGSAPPIALPEVGSPDELITTVASRTASVQPDRTRGDLLLTDPFTGRLPREFAARDAALTRSGPNFRRQLRRALNDDQSDVLDRLRAGRGELRVDELPTFGDQIDRYLGPVRRGLVEIAQAGARAGGASDLSSSALDNLVRQLAKYIVDKVRLPTVQALEQATDHDRERILEPIRSLYRDFRNIGLPDLAEDALFEAFAIGLYDSIEPSAPISWVIDPRSDPDPVCEINRSRADVVKGEPFPSGHARPLSLPGCRCLVMIAEP